MDFGGFHALHTSSIHGIACAGFQGRDLGYFLTGDGFHRSVADGQTTNFRTYGHSLD